MTRPTTRTSAEERARFVIAADEARDMETWGPLREAFGSDFPSKLIADLLDAETRISALKAQLAEARKHAAWASEEMLRAFHERNDVNRDLDDRKAEVTHLTAQVEKARAGLERAKRFVKAARGAIESNQVVDKDARGTLRRAEEDIDALLAALTPSDKEPAP